MRMNRLPALLMFDAPSKQSTLSVERSLKNILTNLEAMPAHFAGSDSWQAAVDDCELLIKAVEHGEAITIGS